MWMGAEEAEKNQKKPLTEANQVWNVVKYCCFSLIRYNSSVDKKLLIKMLMLPSAQAGGRLWVGFDPSDLRTFLGSGFVLLPLCFCLWRRPKKLPNTQQQLQQTENISQSEDVGGIPPRSDSSTTVCRYIPLAPTHIKLSCLLLDGLHPAEQSAQPPFDIPTRQPVHTQYDFLYIYIYICITCIY